MHVGRKRREIGIVALVAQSVILPFAPRCRLCVRSCDRQIFTRFIETSFCMLTMIAGMFSGELFLTSLLVDWWGQQIGSHWGMMTGMLVGNFVGIGAFDTLRKLKRHSDFGLNQL
jgi:hypothetical protein